MHDGLFEFADETDRVFDALLGVSAKRPVAEREATADEIDGGVKRKQKLVTNVAGEREPLRSDVAARKFQVAAARCRSNRRRCRVCRNHNRARTATGRRHYWRGCRDA